MMSWRRAGCGACLWFLILSGTQLGATTVQTVNLFEMVRLADRVFWGTCPEMKTELDAATGFLVTAYTFTVKEGIKGVNAGETIVFRQISQGQKGFGIPGLPQYHKGQEALLFLHADSRIGLTSPVGLSQGVFQIEKIQDYLAVSNSLGNRNLAYNVSAELTVSSGLTDHEQGALEKANPIPLSRFVSLIEKIQNYWSGSSHSTQ